MTKLAKPKNINRIVILNVIGTIIYQGINFLLTPILTRALGTYDFGVVTLYISWVNILMPIVSLNLESVLPLITVYVEDKKQNSYITSLAGLSLISFLTISALIMIFIKPVCALLQFEPIVVVMLLVHCFGQMLVNFMITYYVQYQRTILQFTFSIGISVTTCFATLGLLKIIADPKMKYLCRIIGYAGPYFIGGLICLFIISRLSNKWFCVNVWKFALPICVPFIFHSLSHLILSQSGKIILQNYTADGVENAGFYGFAFTIASIMQVIWTALNNAWIPYYYRLLAKNETEEVKKSANRYMILYTGGFSAFCLIAPEFTRIMGGNKYADADKLVLLMLLGIYMVYMYSFAVNYKTYQKNTKSIALGTIFAAVVNIIFCLLLTPKYSYWGCAVAMLISYFLLFIVHQFTVKDIDGLYTCKARFFLSGGICAVAAVVLSFVLIKYLIIRWVIAIIIGIFLLARIIKQKRIF